MGSAAARDVFCVIYSRVVVSAGQFFCGVMICEKLCSLDHGHLESTALAIAEINGTASSRFAYIGA